MKLSKAKTNSLFALLNIISGRLQGQDLPAIELDNHLVSFKFKQDTSFEEELAEYSFGIEYSDSRYFIEIA